MSHTNGAQERGIFGCFPSSLLLLFHDSGLLLSAGCLTEGGIVVGRVAHISDSPRLPKAVYGARVFCGHVHHLSQGNNGVGKPIH